MIEVETTKKLNHKHICKYIDFQENRTLQESNGKIKQVSYIVYEAVTGGEIFSFLEKTGAFSETMCRHLLK